MKLYLVRHGLTSDRIKNLYHTQDSDLSDEGLKQAEIVSQRFKTISIDKIFSSPAQRAKQTAEKIKEVLQIDIEFTDTIMELKRPTDLEGMNFEDPQAQELMDEVRKNFGNSEYRHSDEENFFSLEERILKFLDLVESSNAENILAISHEVAIKMIVSKLMFGNLLTPEIFNEVYRFLKMSNTGITILEKGDRGWKLLTWNDHAHLSETS